MDVFVRVVPELIDEWTQNFQVPHLLVHQNNIENNEYAENFGNSLLRVSNFSYGDGPVQVVFLNADHFTADGFRKELLNRFDFGICQIGTQFNRDTQKHEIFKGVYYNTDKRDRMIAYSDDARAKDYTPNQLFQTRVRADRLARKLGFKIRLSYRDGRYPSYEWDPPAPQPVGPNYEEQMARAQRLLDQQDGIADQLAQAQAQYVAVRRAQHAAMFNAPLQFGNAVGNVVQDNPNNWPQYIAPWR